MSQEQAKVLTQLAVELYRDHTITAWGRTERAEACRAGAEAIAEVERLRAELIDTLAENDKLCAELCNAKVEAIEERNKLRAELEAAKTRITELECYIPKKWALVEDKPSYDDLADQHTRAISIIGEQQERIAEMEEVIAKAAEHSDTAPHEGCACQVCTLMKRIAELEQEKEEAFSSGKAAQAICELRARDKFFAECINPIKDENKQLKQRIAKMECAPVRLCVLSSDTLEDIEIGLADDDGDEIDREVFDGAVQDVFTRFRLRIAELENKLLLAQADMENAAKDTGTSTLIVTPECDHREPAPGGGYYVCGQPAVLNGKCAKHQSEPNTVAAKDTDAPS